MGDGATSVMAVTDRRDCGHKAAGDADGSFLSPRLWPLLLWLPGHTEQQQETAEARHLSRRVSPSAKASTQAHQCKAISVQLFLILLYMQLATSPICSLFGAP